jgi:hypothetical protein
MPGLAAWVVAIGNLVMVGWQLVALRAAFRRSPVEVVESAPEPQPALG